MTKVAATPIYSKTLQKSSSSEPKGQWLCGFVAWYVALGTRGPSYFVQMMTLGWPWPILQRGQIWSLMLFYGEKLLESHLMEETYSKWPEWQKVYVKIKILTPAGLSAPAPGLYTCMKTGKNLYKIRLQRYFFETCNKWAKWQKRSLCWHQNFIHKGLSAPGIDTCGKTLKNVYKNQN